MGPMECCKFGTLTILSFFQQRVPLDRKQQISDFNYITSNRCHPLTSQITFPNSQVPRFSPIDPVYFVSAVFANVGSTLTIVDHVGASKAAATTVSAFGFSSFAGFGG